MSAAEQLALSFDAPPPSATPPVVAEPPASADAAPVVHEVDLDDYQRGQWPENAARLGPHPHAVLMAAVQRMAEREGWAGAWRRLLRIWWHTLDRLAPSAEDEYLQDVRGLTPDVLEATGRGLAALIDHFHRRGAFCDLLGPVHQEVSSHVQRSGTGQFFTPWSICLLMAEMNGVPDTPLQPDGRPWTVTDPAIGSASTLLAYRGVFARRHGRAWAAWVHFAGQDIDETCVLMARIQLRLTNVVQMERLLATASLPPHLARRALGLADALCGLGSAA